MQFKYKRLKLKTEKDLQIAERLLNQGWKIILADIGESILMEKKGD